MKLAHLQMAVPVTGILESVLVGSRGGGTCQQVPKGAAGREILRQGEVWRGPGSPEMGLVVDGKELTEGERTVRAEKQTEERCKGDVY